ncbi:hypothetical protein ACFV4M_36675 [Kitasatospora indigofera]|uniref:hypothetical protein n=1 Tax=Kitasatospora indigofera TaxID=67307 RepID=UPI00365A5157
MRHDTVRHARANIDGDLVAGDKNVFLVGGGRQPLRLVSPLVLERVRGAFEEPEQWARTRGEFGRRSLVILRGSAGTGKTTAALRLLLGSAVSRIYHLDRNTDLGALAARLDTAGEDGAEGSTGYLVDQPVDAAALRGWLVQGLEGVLHRAGARLVLTVDQEAGLVDPDLLDYVIELTGPPRHHGIVRRYLEWRLGEPAAGQVLGLQEVAGILEERLAGDATCKVAADLASAVWEAAEASASGIPDVTRIRAKLARRGAEDFDMWVESLDDPFLRCYAVALAVLNGLPQEDVASAARSLHRRLNPDRHTVLARDDGRLPRLREPYEVPRRRRLAQLRAHAVPVTFFSPNGSVPAEGLVYKDPGYARRVIRHAWSEYPMQGELLDWLGELADDPSEQVRTHAGVALGVLADSSFQYLAAHVFHPWAAGTSRTRRNAVANALSVTAENPRLRSMVTALAAGWIADPDRPMALATAARVHGVSLGGAEPLAAVDALVRLAVVDHVQVAVAIGDSLTDILAEEESLTAVVLNRLWTAMADHRARPTVLLSFLAVAAQLVVETAGLDLGAAAPNWPALLVSVERDAALRPPFVALWRTALNEAVYRGEAEHVLRVWAALAEADPALRELFLRFVTATAHGDPRTGTVLRRQAADWVAPQTLVPLPRTSAAVTAELDRLETAR